MSSKYTVRIKLVRLLMLFETYFAQAEIGVETWFALNMIKNLINVVPNM